MLHMTKASSTNTWKVNFETLTFHPQINVSFFLGHMSRDEYFLVQQHLPFKHKTSAAQVVKRSFQWVPYLPNSFHHHKTPNLSQFILVISPQTSDRRLLKVAGIDVATSKWPRSHTSKTFYFFEIISFIFIFSRMKIPSVNFISRPCHIMSQCNNVNCHARL